MQSIPSDLSAALDEQGEARPVARSTDPSTSWQAARSVCHIRESQAKIYTILAKSEDPLVDDDIYFRFRATFGRISPSGCRTRRKELVDLGLVKDTKARRELDSGRYAILWVAVPVAEWLAENLEQAEIPL